MKATINKQAKTKFTTSHLKEGKCFLTVYAAIVGDKVPVELRIYDTGKKTTACLWVNDSLSNTYIKGSGASNGFGFDQPSEAAQRAINNAGIVLSEEIDGRGDSAIIEAMQAIATALGHPSAFIFKTHN